MRILLATEGESDEVVADALLRNIFGDPEIQPKRMPARGIAVIQRLLTDIVRAAHFGHFDLLVIHFDLDDTLAEAHQHVHESLRWATIRKEVDTVLTGLAGTAGRLAPLNAVLMAPAQSTDAWLRWALLDGDGKKWEQKHRHTLKRAIYGNPPRRLVERARVYASRLIVQTAECPSWPRSLRDFHDALIVIRDGIGKFPCSTDAAQ
jgi:hypothetical protein